MAIQSIHIGPVEDFLQFDDTETYSDGATPRGLILPVAPTTNNGVLRLADLSTAVNPLIGLSYVVMALSGTLTAERKLTAGTGVTLTDGGENGDATLSIGQAVNTNSNVQFNNVEIDGDLNHDGTNVGFFGTAPTTQPGATAEIKAALASLGLLTDGGATPLNLDGGKLTCDEAEIDGALNHDGTTVGFFGTAPATQSTGWSVSNVTPDKSYDANSTSIDEIADVLGTLIDYLKTIGILAA